MKKLITAFFLLFSTLAYSAQVPDKSQSLVLDDFSFGLYTNASGNKIPPNAARVLRNFLIDEKTGSLVRPNGFSVLGSTTGLSRINFILPFIKADNSVEFLVTDNSKLLRTVDFQTYVTVKEGLTSSNDMVGLQYKTKTWWTNGIDAVFTWDGTTVTVMDGNTYGTLQTPNIQRGKCIETDLKRIWIGNVPTNTSAIYWSTLYSTDGVRVDPDDYRAWQSINETDVGLGDGQQITFLKSFNGTLIAGKERSIYSRYGDTDTSFIFIKTKSKIGFLSQYSVIEHENLLIGHAYDGFYAFDGENVEALTDLIKPDFQTVRADTTRSVSSVWEEKSDFNRGTEFVGTTATAAGFVTILSSVNYDVNYNSRLSTSVYPVKGVQLVVGVAASSSSNYGVYIPTNVPNNFYGYITSMTIQACAGGKSGQAQGTFQLTIRNSRTGQIQVVNPPDTGSCPDYQLVTLNSNIFTSPVYFTGNDLNTGKLTLKLDAVSTTGDFDDGTINIIPSTTPYWSDIAFKNSETGSFVSDVATITVNNAWGNFDSIRNQNGGNISYFIRTSTTATSISTKAWSSILPGTVINSSPSMVYVQWASTITGYNANIDNVSISHNEGNSSITRSFGLDWDGRLYLFVSTETTGNYPIGYVKVRKTNIKNPLAWMQLEGIPVRYMVKYQNYLYAGHASTGSILRMDYGSNYGGNPIVSVYESADLNLGLGFTYKDIWEYLIDAKSNNGATLQIGSSFDNASFNYNYVTLTGSENTIRSIGNPNAGGKSFAKLARIRFINSEADKQLIINNFGIVYVPTKIR